MRATAAERVRASRRAALHKNSRQGSRPRFRPIPVVARARSSRNAPGIRVGFDETAPQKIFYEEYHPYGTSAYRAFQGEVSAKRYRYIGCERDEETGLYLMGARYYAAWLGRWTAADPAGTVDGTNLYVYVRGSPVGLKDPSGTETATAAPHYVRHTQPAGEIRRTVRTKAPEPERSPDEAYKDWERLNAQIRRTDVRINNARLKRDVLKGKYLKTRTGFAEYNVARRRVDELLTTRREQVAQRQKVAEEVGMKPTPQPIFDTRDAAARAALEKSLRLGKAAGKEFYGSIYRIDSGANAGKFSFTSPHVGASKMRTGPPIPVPAGTELVGRYHAHVDEGLGALEFSYEDRLLATRAGVPEYMIAQPELRAPSAKEYRGPKSLPSDFSSWSRAEREIYLEQEGQQRHLP
jgi:RHS repeat-associated protein